MSTTCTGGSTQARHTAGRHPSVKKVHVSVQECSVRISLDCKSSGREEMWGSSLGSPSSLGQRGSTSGGECTTGLHHTRQHHLITFCTTFCNQRSCRIALTLCTLGLAVNVQRVCNTQGRGTGEDHDDLELQNAEVVCSSLPMVYLRRRVTQADPKVHQGRTVYRWSTPRCAVQSSAIWCDAPLRGSPSLKT